MSPRPDGAGRLRRIILETSGLSMPGPVLRTLATLAEHRMKVAVVGTFDLTRRTEVAAFEEAIAQWAAAHRIVATKADLVGPDVFAGAPSMIAAINPLAEVIAIADRASAVLTAFAPLNSAPPLHEIRAELTSAHPRVALCLARPTGDVSYSDLAAWLDNHAAAAGRERRHDVLAATPASCRGWRTITVPCHHRPRRRAGGARTGRAGGVVPVLILENTGLFGKRPPDNEGRMGRVIA
jgi:G3E family GTPase